MHYLLSYFNVKSFELNLRSLCYEFLPSINLTCVLNEMLGVAQRRLS